jgi:hypothetical protein
VLGRDDVVFELMPYSFVDVEPDGDVDGTDLVQEINAGGAHIGQFAADFGNSGCRVD